ncbi:hypothetical protein H9L10_14125 [Phycicoccus endophyticus]|uniref:Cellobiose phosphorylase n=1 Tax=Phycicoccus endophyticus TaxID=1690220 RepID=A0A7G9R149_9MICO|nr:hypothetical protein [Phycicoccus endophyticus]NHI20546.1 hypothetical protein [Phycicoccus endophyticus]QNN49324.1 hypothetical protein H9L10_14125 [Phycicoccus endophyticus]GGL45385.1 hypothetical protein GCM10012283_30010 [Phycicoccus endophyticus]
MRDQPAPSSPDLPDLPVLTGPHGLTAQLTSGGALSRFEAFGRSLLLYPASELEAGPANLHLRVLDGDRADRLPLLGPGSGASVEHGEDELRWRGSWRGLHWSVRLVLGVGGEPDAVEHASWRWEVLVENAGTTPVEVDVVLTHDPALAEPAAVRMNEYYVAQYLDLSPVRTERGTAIAVRQNMPGPTAPWLLLGSLREGAGWATDALQVTERTASGTTWAGLDTRALPSRRHQHEHSLVVLADSPVTLAAGGTHRTGFAGVVLADHPAATGPQDASWLSVAVAETDRGRGAAAGEGRPVSGTVFGAPTLASRPLTDAETDRLGLAPEGALERGPDGRPWAWPSDGGQVVLGSKDLAVLRPHGQILRTGDRLVPDPAALTTTVWMDGTLLSQVTCGHVGRDPLLTGRRSYLGLLQAHGARLLLRTGQTWTLLGAPSAWHLGLDACTWWYAHEDLVLEVRTQAPEHEHELRLTLTVRSGGPVEVLLALATDGGQAPVHSGDGLDLDGWRLAWSGAAVTVGGDEPLHSDGRARDASWLTLAVAPTEHWQLRLAHPVAAAGGSSGKGAPFWDSVARTLSIAPAETNEDAALVAPIGAAVPWFAHDAVVHYLAPRGLEQYSGGAWGTRDVCQGPVGLLTALDRPDIVGEVLERVFAGQNARGDWPQAFEFLPPGSAAGQQDAHGDVVFWPLLATGEHLLASGDPDLLERQLPFVGDDGPTEAAPVLEHLGRALEHVEASTVAGSPLPAYGHGDWNDSLQPADPRLASHLVSVWTAVLQTQALRALAAGLEAVDAAPDLARRAAALADATHEEIRRELLLDGVLPGYLLHHDDGTTEPLVHPRDTRTGLTYGVLPWIHAVTGDLLDPKDAEHHLRLVEAHLLGPDGARLFDRPVGYGGGPMGTFQRAEASTFWGREIGLMYVHAHLRYAEALARTGDGPGLLRALALATPAGAAALVPGARPRQTSCYYSSSDAVFADRYEAADRYADLMAGAVPLEGGWRVYSSGPGLFLRLVVEALLGVRRRGSRVELDPVLDPAAGPLQARVPFEGGHLDLLLRPGDAGHGVRSVSGPAGALATTPLANPYREGGVELSRADLHAAVARRGAGDGGPDLVVETG